MGGIFSKNSVERLREVGNTLKGDLKNPSRNPTRKNGNVARINTTKQNKNPGNVSRIKPNNSGNIATRNPNNSGNVATINSANGNNNPGNVSTKNPNNNNGTNNPVKEPNQKLVGGGSRKKSKK